MQVSGVLTELYGRLPDLVASAVDGLDADALTTPPGEGANPVGWLVWHLTRVQDHHVAELLDEDQLWVAGDWAARMGLEPDPSNTGYGHGPPEVAAVRPEGADALTGYHSAVHRRTLTYLEALSADDLDRVVDEAWDPPVTLGVRVVSIADDSLQHAGQAAYARGLLGR
jgi:uncharacterized damage-inducible protein DinB